MKRNILLGFLLIGLVVMEWGCRDDDFGACPPSTHNVTGIDSVQVFSIDSNQRLTTLSSDSIRYDELVFKVNFGTQLISKIKSNSSSAYATAPCPPDHANWFIDNISVSEVEGIYFTDWEVAGRYYESFTHSDSLRRGEFWEVPIKMYLRPRSAPSQIGSYKFIIKIEATEGNIFETTTDPIIITP